MAETAVAGCGATVSQRFDYAPHGEPRRTGAVRTLQTIPSCATGPACYEIPWRGFTGHEHVDFLSVIHMSGRMYDPLLGRPLQTDPLVQAPYVLQTWNPYSYVQNNPLSLTDPTGMFAMGRFLRTVAAVVVTYYTGGMAAGAGSAWAGAAGAAGGGFAAGAIQSGSVRGGVYGAFSGMLFYYGVGSGFQNVGQSNAAGAQVSAAGLTGARTAGKVLAHGVAGGVMASLQGGKFGHGFDSAGFTEAMGPAIGRAGGHAARATAAALVGGTASMMTGGKFANGAVTAAFSYAFSATQKAAETRRREQWMWQSRLPITVTLHWHGNRLHCRMAWWTSLQDSVTPPALG